MRIASSVIAYHFDTWAFEILSSVDEPLNYADYDDDEESNNAIICCEVSVMDNRKELRHQDVLTHTATSHRECRWKEEEYGCHNHIRDAKL